MKNRRNNNREKSKSRKNSLKVPVISGLLVLTVVLCYGSAYLGDMVKNRVTADDIVTLDSPDSALMGGWIFQNPDNEYELLAFEFGPDSTFIVMNFANGEQVGETISGKCVYLTVKGYSAIEMTPENGETKYYYYTVVGDYATFTDKDTGEVMPLKLVKKVTLAE